MCPKAVWMSDFQKQLLQKHNLKMSKCLNSYHIYMNINDFIYRDLKFIKELGVKIGPVHNVISFNQKPWMTDYMDFKC